MLCECVCRLSEGRRVEGINEDQINQLPSVGEISKLIYCALCISRCIACPIHDYSSSPLFSSGLAAVPLPDDLCRSPSSSDFFNRFDEGPVEKEKGKRHIKIE